MIPLLPSPLIFGCEERGELRFDGDGTKKAATRFILIQFGTVAWPFHCVGLHSVSDNEAGVRFECE